MVNVTGVKLLFFCLITFGNFEKGEGWDTVNEGIKEICIFPAFAQK
jgi:hypothetical protein